MTTIAIDYRFAGTGTGLARYCRELVDALLKQNDGRFAYVLIVRKDSDVPALRPPHRAIVADIPHYSLKEQTRLPAILRATKADIAFSPHFNVPFFCPLPFITTVHDLILHRHPGGASLGKRIAYKILMQRALRRAKEIIAVSEWTKQDIRETYGKTIAKKTTVIREGVSEKYVPQSIERIDALRSRYELERPYFLYVGNCKPHKNVAMLLEAFSRARPDAELILVSGGDDARALMLPQNARLLENVSDEDLPVLYSAARSFVTASLDEGFCLPVAEALACGCPVIATNRSAIPETAGGHAKLVEPTVEDFMEAFQNPPTLNAPVKRGSWKTTAEETAAIFARLM